MSKYDSELAERLDREDADDDIGSVEELGRGNEMNSSDWTLRYVCGECSRTGFLCAEHYYKENPSIADTVENVRLGFKYTTEQEIA